MQGTRFAAASFDGMTTALTAVFVLAIACGGIGVSVAAPNAGIAVLILGAAGVILVLSYGFAPAAYVLSPDRSLRVVRRLFGTVRFSITKVAPVEHGFGIGGVRLMGSGGVFGWYGIYWRPRFGRYRAFVTHRQRLLRCEGPRGPILISPDDPTAFLAAAAQL